MHVEFANAQMAAKDAPAILKPHNACAEGEDSGDPEPPLPFIKDAGKIGVTAGGKYQCW